jgi:hypothetical protein
VDLLLVSHKRCQLQGFSPEHEETAAWSACRRNTHPATGVSCSLCANQVTKMKANGADEPYVVERHGGGSGSSTVWRFSLTYARLDDFMPLAQEQLVISRLPARERCEWLGVACQWGVPVGGACGCKPAARGLLLGSAYPPCTHTHTRLTCPGRRCHRQAGAAGRCRQGSRGRVAL